jgi:hypothetical protein
MRGVLFIRDIDPQLKHDFKALCCREDTTLTQAVADLMTDALARGCIRWPQLKTSSGTIASKSRRRDTDTGPDASPSRSIAPIAPQGPGATDSASADV